MQLSVVNENKLNILSLSGEVDMHESPRAREQILNCLKSGSNLLVDLSAVSYIDSSGIASLVEGLQLSKNQHLDFGLVSISDAVTQVLQLARLDRVFTIYDSVDAYRNEVRQ